jgi:hypothetical protein
MTGNHWTGLKFPGFTVSGPRRVWSVCFIRLVWFNAPESVNCADCSQMWMEGIRTSQAQRARRVSG